MTDQDRPHSHATDAAVGAVAALEAAAADAVGRVGAATVSIGRDGRGSGLVTAAGTVVTNAHHLRDRTTSVTFGDGRTEQAEVVGADLDGDLAVLSVPTGDVAPVPLGAVPGLAPGAVVFAVARSGRGPRVALGLVSSVTAELVGPRGRRVGGAVEHSASPGRGATGGPLVDARGRVVALNTHRLGDGAVLALPVDAALLDRLAALAGGTPAERPTLGVTLAPPEVAAALRRSVGLDERTGLLVREVDGDGIAAAAGVREGDLLVTAAGDPAGAVTALGGTALGGIEDLRAALDAWDTAGPLRLGIVRGAEELTVEVLAAAAA